MVGGTDIWDPRDWKRRWEVNVDENDVEPPNAENHVVEKRFLRFYPDALVDGVVLLMKIWIFELVLILLQENENE